MRYARVCALRLWVKKALPRVNPFFFFQKYFICSTLRSLSRSISSITLSLKRQSYMSGLAHSPRHDRSDNLASSHGRVQLYDDRN